MSGVITDHLAWPRRHRPHLDGAVGGDLRRAIQPRPETHPLDTDMLLWIVLAVTIGTVLTLDLLVFNRRAHAPSFREAAVFSIFYIALGLTFGALVFMTRGAEDGTAYLAGYLLELSLSIDNVFVFALIFAAFVVPLKYQHRVLFYGILGAIVFRAIFIGLGAAIIETFHWAIYVFGLLLLYTGYRMWRQRNDHMIDPTNNRLLRLFRRFVPTTDGYREQRFVVTEHGRRLATPLLAVLLVVESSDILFAIDSVPAIFSVTTDTFLVFSSNAFAILGLRSLYFLLAGAVDKFRYLKPGLSALLIFAGLKILLADIVPIPIPLSLAIIIAILATAIGASLIADRRDIRRRRTDAGARPPRSISTTSAARPAGSGDGSRSE
jgi:tellurite resistance protein TerC